MKAVLTFHSHPFGKTHNLEALGEQCLRVDTSLREFVEEAVSLTEFAWRFRYPGEPEELSEQEVADAITISARLYETIVARLPAQPKP